jgi:hypothetical protein
VTWEDRLAAEGLAPLDCDDGRGGILVSNRGAGREVAEDELSSREMDLELLRTYKFRKPKDRELWRRHCQGHGYQKIARETRTPEKYVRVLFARVSHGRLKGGLEDTGGLPTPKVRTRNARNTSKLIHRNLLLADPGMLAGLLAVLL